LAYALIEDYAAIILVDATPRGDATGTTYLIEIDPVELAKLDAPSPDAHSMNPVNALKMAQSLGPVTAKVFLVGCEPANLEAENGQIGLSETVQRAIPQAIETIEDLLRKELPGREIEKERVQVCA
jgi:hydrogenase maturation protease